MKINAMTVCVNYADLLAPSIERWKTGCDSLLVITDLTDGDTLRLCHRWGLVPYCTDAFYRHSALFNKGAAMEEARQRMPWEDWILFFDADVIPPADWRAQVEQCLPRCGTLYGCHRRLDDGTLKSEGGEIAGFFQLFHTGDSRVQDVPLLDGSWRHAGGYDSVFMARWPADRRMLLPLEMQHQGDHGRNWCGRGNDEAMSAMMRRRRETRDKASERLV